MSRPNYCTRRQLRFWLSLVLALSIFTLPVIPSGRVTGASAGRPPTAVLAPQTPAATSSESAAATARAQEAYGKLGLSFEANQGQTDERVRFITRAGGATVLLTQTEAVFVLSAPDDNAEAAQRNRASQRAGVDINNGSDYVVTPSKTGFTFAPASFTIDDLNFNRELLFIGTATSTTLPALSIDDVTVNEGNAGTTSATFNVTLSPASAQTVTVNFLTADLTANAGSDYVSSSGQLTFNPGDISLPITVLVNGDTLPESTEAFFVNLSAPSNATLGDAAGIGRITNDDAQASLQFSATNYNANEDCAALVVTVTRTGDTAIPMAVDYTTLSGTASDRSDHTFAAGTLNFAPGEASQSFNLLITEDSLVEGTETATIILDNPMGGAVVGTPGTATLTITDDAIEPATNAIDDTALFVCQHYHDFLNRQADAAGQAFWTNNIDSCGADAACRSRKREDTSAAFFLSIEFQQTGFLVERAYQAAFNRRVLIGEFLPDTQSIGHGIQVGVGNWEQQLGANKQAYFDAVVMRPEFLSLYSTLTNDQYVDKLNGNTGSSLTQAERDALVAGLNGLTETRASVLRKVSENAAFTALEFNRAFVLMQYFGYLRRNADEAGFQFWLTKLNQFGGDFRHAEMVKAFITSTEYRQRFGQP